MASLPQTPGDSGGADSDNFPAPKSCVQGNPRASGRDAKILLCEYCDASFTSSSGLYYHKASMHLQKKFVCTICGKVLRRKENLMHHMKTHNNPTSTECPYCHVYFGAKHISSHIVENHREEMMKGSLNM
ncbi:hypothetical protein ACOMHN_059013 [Nucella lapillus]